MLFKRRPYILRSDIICQAQHNKQGLRAHASFFILFCATSCYLLQVPSVLTAANHLPPPNTHFCPLSHLPLISCYVILPGLKILYLHLQHSAQGFLSKLVYWPVHQQSGLGEALNLDAVPPSPSTLLPHLQEIFYKSRICCQHSVQPGKMSS